jgi:hypothetical protein
MKAFTVHDAYKIAQFTDAPCITIKLQYEKICQEKVYYTVTVAL